MTTSPFSTLRTMKNAVGTKSISTSTPELWGFEVLGVRPQCKKSGIFSMVKIAQMVPLKVVINALNVVQN